MELKPGFHPYSAMVDGCRVSLRYRYMPASEEVIVFIHGLACSWDAFRHALENDRLADRSMLFVDLIGFGDSEKPQDFSYSMQAQARVVDALLAMLPQLHLYLVAHSMGGAIALLLSSATLGRVRSFANVEGNLTGDDCGILSRSVSTLSYDHYQRRGYGRHLAIFGNHDMFRFEKTTPFAIHRSARSLIQCSDSGELLTRFQRLACRKGYFYGEENKEMAVLPELGFARKVMIPDSGHGMMVENPLTFFAELGAFIDSA